MDDIPEDTIDQCRQGNAEAFAKVIRYLEKPLFAYVVRMGFTSLGCDPEDVVQEILVKVCMHIEEYQRQDQVRFAAWVFTIARNHCASLFRKTKAVRSQPAPDDRLAGVIDQGADEPVDILSRSEAVQRVEAVVQGLPEAMRTAFILRYYHQMGFEDIADVLGCSEGAARMRVARAKQFVSAALRSYEGEQ